MKKLGISSKLEIYEDVSLGHSSSHLLPTLLDRLRDDAPFRKAEAPSEYAVSRKKMGEIIRRDLAFLLNTSNTEDLINRSIYPEAAASTINFGIPPLAGGYLSESKWVTIERLIRRAISDFEPRVIPQSLQVIPLIKDTSTRNYNVLLFEIRGLIHMKPYPLAFLIQSSVDLENDRFTILGNGSS